MCMRVWPIRYRFRVLVTTPVVPSVFVRMSSRIWGSAVRTMHAAKVNLQKRENRERATQPFNEFTTIGD
jgi:hypothetical protein